MPEVRMLPFGGATNRSGGTGSSSSFTSPLSNLTTFREQFFHFGSTNNILSIAAGKLRFTGGASSTLSCRCIYAAKSVQLALSRGVDQFSQLTFSNNSGSVNRPVIGAVFCGGENGDLGDATNCPGYALVAQPDLNQVVLAKITTAFPPAGANIQTLAFPISGTVIRLEGRIVGSTTELSTFYNGVQQGVTIVDNSGPFQTGIPGFGTSNSNLTPSFFDISDFSCGAL